jgi:hypothetical protein
MGVIQPYCQPPGDGDVNVLKAGFSYFYFE